MQRFCGYRWILFWPLLLSDVLTTLVYAHFIIPLRFVATNKLQPLSCNVHIMYKDLHKYKDFECIRQAEKLVSQHGCHSTQSQLF